MIAPHHNTVESRRQAVQAAIDATKSAPERNRLGQFATPNTLALEIARYVNTLIGSYCGGIRFADPSIGSGSFFLPRSQYSDAIALSKPLASNSTPHSPTLPVTCGPKQGYTLFAMISLASSPTARVCPRPT